MDTADDVSNSGSAVAVSLPPSSFIPQQFESDNERLPPPSSSPTKAKWTTKHPPILLQCLRLFRSSPPSSLQQKIRPTRQVFYPHRRIPFDSGAAQLANELGTSTDCGLEESEVQTRLNVHGLNVLRQQQNDTIGSLLWKQMSNAMTFVLVVALITAFSIKDYPDGAVIAGI
jgi:magnesium-transporting ATPase (P-type)